MAGGGSAQAKGGQVIAPFPALLERVDWAGVVALVEAEEHRAFLEELLWRRNPQRKGRR